MYSKYLICAVLMLQLFLHREVLPAQQTSIDSLHRAYHTSTSPQEKLQLLKDIADQASDLTEKISYSEQLISYAREQSSVDFIISGYLFLGNALRLNGEMTRALEAFFSAQDLATQHQMDREKGLSQIALADVYSVMGNSSQAINYYEQSIDILRKLKDSIGLASALLNAGDEYWNTDQLDLALTYFDESQILFEALDHKAGMAYNLGNIGLVYAKKSMAATAEEKMSEAISILEEMGDMYPICTYLIYMSEIYRDKGDEETSLKYALKGYNLAKTQDFRSELSLTSLHLSQLYEKMNDPINALDYYKQYVANRDSILNIESVREAEKLRSDFEIAQRQMQVDLLEETQRNQRTHLITSIVAAGSLFLLALGLYRRYKYISRTNAIIKEEQTRSENLLLNILPAETAEELKKYGKVKAKKFESVTVLFTDFKDFSAISERVDPEILVKSVDYYFSKFDEIVGNFAIEKIKTVGDAYLCAAGLHDKSHFHAEKILKAAISILDVINSPKPKDILDFQIRIGVHTGPVVAGVVGSRKFAYDIWGDTVNIAARLESSCDPGRINLSKTTYELTKDIFQFEYRGLIAIKNIQELEMYYLQS